MKGSITAANRYDRQGAAFIIKFPVKADARPMETAA
jgi:hypothetical protein